MPSRRLWKPCGIRILLFEKVTAISADGIILDNSPYVLVICYTLCFKKNTHADFCPYLR